MLGFDLLTGKPRWTNIVPSASSLVAEGGRVLAIDGKHVRTISTDTGAVNRCEVSPRLVNAIRELATPASLQGGRIERIASGIRLVTTAGQVWYRRSVIPLGLVEDGVLVHQQARSAEDQNWGTAVLDGRTGEERWFVRRRFVLSTSPAGGPVLLGVAGQRKVEAVTPGTGARLWTRTLPSAVSSARSFDTGTSFVVPHGTGTEFSVLDHATGQILWSARPVNPALNQRASVSGGVDWAVASDGVLVIMVVAYEPGE